MDLKNSSEELLPCPFCGSTNLKFLEGQIIGNRPVGPNRMIRCEECHCTGPYTEKSLAIKHWNKRKGPMNKNGVMTALLAIEMITVFILGIWVACNYTDVKKVKEDNVALKARVEEMQKSNTQLNELVKTQTRDKQDCLVLAKVSRGVWDKRLKECEERQNNWVQEACGVRCAVYVELANKCVNGINELSVMAKEK